MAIIIPVAINSPGIDAPVEGEPNQEISRHNPIRIIETIRSSFRDQEATSSPQTQSLKLQYGKLGKAVKLSLDGS